MMGAKGGDLKPHGHCHRTRGYKPSRVPRRRETKKVRALSLSFPLALAYNRVTRERGGGGCLEYTPRVIYTLRRLAIGIDPWGPSAFLHAIYSRCVYDLGSRARASAGSGQVLFFIDSFERAFGHAGTLSPRADFQPACERR